MKYKYKNLKPHITLHGIEPLGEKVFDHPILGGGIELIEIIEEKKDKKKIKKNMESEL
jgi:hypothetical protein